MERVLSGIQPTAGGMPHLGNFLGALKGYVELQNSGHQVFYMIANQHATTVSYKPEQLRQANLVLAASMIALGIDTERSTLFVQSRVPQHSMLAAVLAMSVASMGPLERMTQFKDKAGANGAEVGLGLFIYPVLMAADILLYRATTVPVGDDQHQHLQFTAELAKRFNHRFGKDFFAIPKPRFAEYPRIMSLSDPLRKMSKSDPNQDATVYLTDTMDQAARKYRRAQSESALLPSSAQELSSRAAAQNLLGIYCALSGESLDQACTRFGAQGFSILKSALCELHESKIVPIGKRIEELLENKGFLQQTLEKGAVVARKEAQKTIDQVYNLVGF